MDWARDFEVMPFDSSVLRPLADAAAGAFEARTGKPLDASLAGAGDLPKALYKAPVCVMVVSDEKIAYANDAACEFAGKKHTELIGSATTLPATVAGNVVAEPINSVCFLPANSHAASFA